MVQRFRSGTRHGSHRASSHRFLNQGLSIIFFLRTIFTFSPQPQALRSISPKVRIHILLRLCPQQGLLGAPINQISSHHSPQITEGRLGWPEQEAEKGKDIYLNSIHSELIHGSCYWAIIWFSFNTLLNSPHLLTSSQNGQKLKWAKTTDIPDAIHMSSRGFSH